MPPLKPNATVLVPAPTEPSSTMLALPGNEDVESINPLVGETNDGYLNDIRGRHITREDVFAAIRSAKGGRRILRRHRRPSCPLPLRLLPRLPPVEREHRRLPPHQNGLSQDMLNVFCSCPMVRLVLFGKRRIPTARAERTLLRQTYVK
jgi:Peptidase family S58